MPPINAWGALRSENNNGNNTEAFAGALPGSDPSNVTSKPGKKKDKGGFGAIFSDPGRFATDMIRVHTSADPITSIATRGYWKGPGGEFKSNEPQNRFLDFTGGARDKGGLMEWDGASDLSKWQSPTSSHRTFGMNWGAGENPHGMNLYNDEEPAEWSTGPGQGVYR